ncbi:PREDICTED: hepcidin [Dipodomys ordii]|uniref:Hepcidin n=1 Tax=Dipodomys ordii TaxID=10020 RepID=A0A1S3FZD4_DIPOR|nr:PREDICTED: hepcidin [Dipodomys ordii]
MALSARVPAACLLLLLLLSSLASAADLQQQAGELAALQPQHTAEARSGLQPVPQKLRERRDSHFPICVFCCGCCKMESACGICCKT